MKYKQWVVIEHVGTHEYIRLGPVPRLEDAERFADQRGPLFQVKEVIFTMGGCKDWLGYYLSVGTSDGEFYKIREV